MQRMSSGLTPRGPVSPEVPPKRSADVRPGHVSRAAIVALQRSAGNRSVVAMLEGLRSVTVPVVATVASAESPADATAEDRIDHESPDDGGEDREGGMAEMPEGIAVSRPDMPADEELLYARDSISPHVGYDWKDVKEGVGVPSSEFGHTSVFLGATKDTTVTREKGRFTVRTTVDSPIRWITWPPGGPAKSKQTDIRSDHDAAINQGNYKMAATDLTPGPDAQPPREFFWASDLTKGHELFHAWEASTLILDAAAAAESWLGTQTASSLDDVDERLHDAMGQLKGHFKRRVGTEDEREARAYGSNAAFYRARAAAIRQCGDAKGFPEE
jgi:hypothetical protein